MISSGVLYMDFVNYHLDSGRKPVVRKKGYKRYSVVMIDDIGVRVLKVPFKEDRYMIPVEGYSLKKACNGILKAGKVLGITKEAKKILMEGKKYESNS